jgi:integrase
VKDSTIDKELRQLRAALHWGVRQQWMPSAPYIGSPGGGRPRDRWLTREEVARLIEAVEEPHVRLFIFLGLYTGARTRALLGLHWDDIDFKR